MNSYHPCKIIHDEHETAKNTVIGSIIAALTVIAPFLIIL